MALPATNYEGEQYPWYSFADFAIDSEGEWHVWGSKYYPNEPMHKVSALQQQFQEQQVVIYKLLRQKHLSEVDFAGQLRTSLGGRGEELTFAILKTAYQFYVKKKAVHDARYTRYQAGAALEEAEEGLRRSKGDHAPSRDECRRLEQALEQARSDYATACSWSLSVGVAGCSLLGLVPVAGWATAAAGALVAGSIAAFLDGEHSQTVGGLFHSIGTSMSGDGGLREQINQLELQLREKKRKVDSDQGKIKEREEGVKRRRTELSAADESIRQAEQDDDTGVQYTPRA